MLAAFDVQQLLEIPSLVALIVVLGVDNVVAITVITRGIPPVERRRARAIGLGLAALLRISLLLLIVFVLKAADWSLVLFTREINLRHLLLFAGGLLLLIKSGWELSHRLQPRLASTGSRGPIPPLRSAVLQVVAVDLTLSLDSVVTVATMASQLGVMIAVILIEVGIILFFAGRVTRLLNRHPSLETLAICALGLVGAVLMSEGLGWTIPRSHIYLMMLFAIFVQMVNLRIETVSARESEQRRAAHEPGTVAVGRPRVNRDNRRSEVGSALGEPL